jgi:hypothetical protein
MTIIKATAIAASLLLAVGCGGSKEPVQGDQAARTGQVPVPEADRSAGGGGQTIVPASGWTEVGVRDVSYPGARRINVTILVPPGLSREELTQRLTDAAREIGEREKAKAVLLDAFRWSDEVTDGTYSVGRVYWAPNGRWEDAGKDEPMQAKVELGTLYFLEGRRYYAVGDSVRLAGAGGAAVPLFETLDTSKPDQVVASVPDGTPAAVVGRSIKVFGGRTEHIRYRVAVGAGDGRETGWVAPESIGPLK